MMNSLVEVSFVTPAVGGITPDSKASVALMSVAMLLAASLWPTFGLT